MDVSIVACGGISDVRHNGNNLGEVDLPRTVEIDRLLTRQHGVTVEQLATMLNVSTKTIRRDLDTMHRLYGRRLIVDVGQHGRKTYRIDAENRIFARWVAGRVNLLV